MHGEVFNLFVSLLGAVETTGCLLQYDEDALIIEGPVSWQGEMALISVCGDIS